jgi:CBS domain-containing protein
MGTIVREVMTPDPVIIDLDRTVAEAAELMRDRNIGDVIVQDDTGHLGILTDRDIVVRVVAAALDPHATTVGQVATSRTVTVSPDAPFTEAVQKMRDAAVRRLPVVADGRVVGVVSLGDLAVARDQESALADISAAPPND